MKPWVMSGALTLETYPFDTICIECRKCGRAGRYRRETLQSRFGDKAAMPDVLAQVADCRRRRNASDPCGVVYPDLRRRTS
jgi:hypothetical protein